MKCPRPSRRSVLAAGTIGLVGSTTGLVVGWFTNDNSGESVPDHDCRPATVRWAGYQGDRRNSGTATALPAIEESPAVETVADGLVRPNGLAIDESNVYVTEMSRLEAYDRDGGTHRWSVDAPENEFIDTAPAVSCQSVFVQTGRSVIAFDADDGEERWRYDAGNDSFEPALLADGDTLIVGTSGIVALDAATGEKRWETDLGNGDCLGIGADGDSVYAFHIDGGDYGRLSAYDIDRDELRWTVGGEADEFDHNAGNPVVGEGRVYLQTASGTLRAIETDDGAIAWTRTSALNSTAPPAIAADGTVVVPNLGPRGVTAALDPDDGSTIWETTPGDSQSPPVVGDGVVYADTGDGIRALSLEDGTERWRISDARAIGSLAVGENALYASRNDRLVKLAAQA